MLPTCLMPRRQPVITLMGMSEAEFYELYVGDDPRAEFDDPDIAVIDAFGELVEERAHALLPDWLHREAVIDVVECFAPIPSDVASLDSAIHTVSAWLCGIGPRQALRSNGTLLQEAERWVEVTASRLADNGDDKAMDAHRKAIDALAALAETSTLHLSFETVWISLSLLADRVRVVVDLPDEGEIDMGGHHYDGDEDADDAPVTPPLEMV